MKREAMNVYIIVILSYVLCIYLFWISNNYSIVL